MYYYKNCCPYTRVYSWEYSNMYRSDEDTAKEEVKAEEQRSDDEQRQYPGASTGMPQMPGSSGIPGVGAGPMPGMMHGQYTGNPAEIMRLIEMNHPDIMRTVMGYGIPFPEARRIVMMIIRATLRYGR